MWLEHSETEEMRTVVEPCVVKLVEECIAAVAPWAVGDAMYANQPAG